MVKNVLYGNIALKFAVKTAFRNKIFLIFVL